MSEIKLRRLDSDKGRVYVSGNSRETWKLYPSVTTILSLLPKDELKQIEAAIGTEKLKELGDKAVERGTSMHLFLENYFRCIKKGGDSDKCLLYTQRKTVDSLLHDGFNEDRIKEGRKLFYKIEASGVFEDVAKVLYLEKFMHSSFGFAGAGDFGYYSVNKNIVLIDFKSASSPRSGEAIFKYKHQLAAYKIMFEEMFKLPVSRCELWIGHPDGFQHIVIELEELQEYEMKFKKLCEQFHEIWDNSHFFELLENELQIKTT